MMEVRVSSRRNEAEGIVSFELVPAGPGDLPAFEPGAHVDVQVPGGPVRQYSLCSPAGQTGFYRIAVLRDPDSRGGSVALHSVVGEGDHLRISAPRNHFPLAGEAAHTLLLGGGIGITPMLCMADSLAGSGRSFELHYCTRSRERTAFHDALLEEPWHDRVHFHFDDAAAEQRLDLQGVLAGCPEGTHLYVCGPRGFMDAVIGAARTAGWPETRIHFEYFSGEVARHVGDTAFEVEIASSGRCLAVPAGRTIAEVLKEAGIRVEMSCEQGVCGTCMTGVLAGVPDHRDSYLDAEERAANDQVLVCCSRSRTARLVLDL